MAVGIQPLRLRYMNFVMQPAVDQWARPLITLEPGDVFESVAAYYTLLSETTDTSPSHVPDWTACFLKWTYSDPNSTPRNPAPGAIAQGENTIALRMNIMDTWATTEGTAFKTVNYLSSATAQYLAIERATLWICITNTFGATDPYNLWSVWGPASIFYRADGNRI